MLFLVDKPQGITSFDVIRILRTHLQIKKIGHSGTLDPMATGLMILATDQDTKKLNLFLGGEKTYRATIDLSKISDTWDTEYRDHYEEIQVEQQPEKEEIEKLLQSLVPSHILPLPPFSAKKKEGKRLYTSARKGNHIMEEREMFIHNIVLTSYTFPEIQIQVQVGGGTYIRSIAYWLGKQLHTGGILTQLRRIESGKHNIITEKNRKEIHCVFRGKDILVKYAEIQD